jgi:hypothetical protein
VGSHGHTAWHVGQLLPVGTGLAMVGGIYWGWIGRHERYLAADEGVGYWLGVAGLGCMTSLLLYSVRKRASLFGELGPIRRWLSVHMALGLAGPLLILFHSNFGSGSLNSNVALGCVLVVASSGVIGRVLYPRIHHGLTGRRATLAEVRSSMGPLRKDVTHAAAREPRLAEALAAIEVLAARGGGTYLARRLTFRKRARELLRGESIASDRQAGTRSGLLSDYVDAAARVQNFMLYERLFAYWHSFHMPFCLLLFIAAAVHVVAVHLY